MNLNLIRQFLQERGYQGFEPLFKSEEALTLFLKALLWEKEIQLVIDFYTQKIIPECLELQATASEQLKTSGFSFVAEQGENIVTDEFIRFGCISIYHKYEALIDLIIGEFSSYSNRTTKDFTEQLNSYFKEKNIKKPKSGILYKFSYISDCTKHQNAIASNRNDPPKAFINYPKGKKISIAPNDFKEDAILFISFIKRIIMVSFAISAFDGTSIPNEFRSILDRM